MLKLLLVIHILCSIFLIFFILLNQGKGSELGAINQNNELLSSRESNKILNRIIIFVAILSVVINFFVFFCNKENVDSKPIVDIHNN